jgi:uncharacterized membrane protein (UPF0136 family)
MGWLNVLLVLFALLSIGLGTYGYVNSNSIQSLIAGVAIGVLMLGTVALAKSHPRWGRIGSLVVCLLVIGRFLPIFIRTQDWLPAGIMAISAITVAVCLIGAHLAASARKNASSQTVE